MGRTKTHSQKKPSQRNVNPTPPDRPICEQVWRLYKRVAWFFFGYLRECPTRCNRVCLLIVLTFAVHACCFTPKNTHSTPFTRSVSDDYGWKHALIAPACRKSWNKLACASLSIALLSPLYCTIPEYQCAGHSATRVGPPGEAGRGLVNVDFLHSRQSALQYQRGVRMLTTELR